MGLFDTNACTQERLQGFYLVKERESVDLLHNETEGGKHGNAAVLQLSLAEDANIEDLRETKRVESNIARKRSVEVSRLLQEGNGVRERTGENRHARSGDRWYTANRVNTIFRS